MADQTVFETGVFAAQEAVVASSAKRRHCNAATSVALLHHRVDPVVANGMLRAVATGINGKENPAHATDNILQWNVSHSGWRNVSCAKIPEGTALARPFLNSSPTEMRLRQSF
jgi:hypothetical protein